MKKSTFFLCALVSVLFLFSQNKLSAQSCENIGFELGDFTNWIGKTGTCCPISLTYTGIVFGRHTIMTDTTQYDTYTNNKLRCIPPGHRYSARLGNNSTGAQAESLTYKMLVDGDNSLFIWKFAVVLEDPSHSVSEQPRFQISVKDQSDNIVDACAEYLVVAAATIPGFQNNGQIRWRDWTTVGLNLTDYIGQEISIEIATGDCSQGGHFGYGYFVGICQPMDIIVSYCEGSNVAILSAPDGFAEYTWSTGEKTRDITVYSPIEGSTYECTLTSVMGCTAKLTSVIRETFITPDFTYDLVDCDKREYQFTNTSTTNLGSLGNFYWDFGDGTYSTSETPIHTFPALGEYNVKLVVENTLSLCLDSITRKVTLTAPPQIGIDQKDLRICQGDSMLIKATGADFYKWNNGTTADSICINRPGKYFVIGVANHTGCSDTLFFDVGYFPQPDFRISTNPVGCMELQFDPIEQGTTTTNNQFYWDFGDGNTATQKSVRHTFSTSGEQFVKLVVVNEHGCSAEFSQKVNVAPPPAVSLDKLPIFCQGDSIVLKALGADAYEWSNGSTKDSVCIKLPGAYFIVGTSAEGCKDTLFFTAKYYDQPDFKIDINHIVCKEYGFDAIENADSTQNNSFYWDFGDGNTANQKTVKHTFLASGEYTIKLIVENQYSCTKEFSQKLQVSDPPTILLDREAKFCKGDSVLIKANGAENYLWSNGSTADSIYISVPGSYYVIGTANNCSRHLSFEADYYPEPDISINSQIVDCLTVEFSVNEIGDTLQNNSYIWDFGDGTQSNGSKIKHVYSMPGEYIVSVTAVSENNCSATITEKITIAPFPVVSIDREAVFCPGDSILLKADGAHTYQWSTGQSGNEIYISQTGDYYVVGTSLTQCIDTLYFTAKNYIQPEYQIRDSISSCKTIKLEAFGIKNTSANDQYFWDLGDGNFTSGKEIVHIYPSAGDYNVKLTVVDTIGCSAYFYNTIKVHSDPIITLNKEAKFCQGDSVLLKAAGAKTYKWSNGQIGDITYISQPGIYYVEGVSEYGCTSIFTFEASYYQAVNAFIKSTQISCFDFEFSVAGLTDEDEKDILSYYWEFGDGAIAGTQTVRHTYGSFGLYIVKLRVKTLSDCEIWFETTVNVSGIPDIQLDKEAIFCEGDSIVVYATGAQTYEWSNGSKEDFTVIKSAGNYSVTGFSGTNCMNILNFHAKYYQPIEYNVFSDNESVSKTSPSIYLWIEGNEPPADCKWTFPNGDVLYGQSARYIFHEEDISTNEYLIVDIELINPNGCKVQLSKRVNALLEDIPNTFVPNIGRTFLPGRRLQIYNKNGILLYEGKDGWDGTYNGSLVKNDTYYYIIQYYMPNNKEKIEKGFVTVIR